MSRAPPPYPGSTATSGGASSTRRNHAASSKASAGANGAAGSSAAQAISTAETSHTYRPSPIDAILAEQGLERHHLEPPSWRAPWILRPPPGSSSQADRPLASNATVGLGPNKSLIRLAGAPAPVAGPGGATSSSGSLNTPDADGGCTAWPVFYPPHDGMDEDRLTEQVVKHGFAAKSLVQVSDLARDALVTRHLLTRFPSAPGRPRRSPRTSTSMKNSSRATFSATCLASFRPSAPKPRRNCLHMGAITFTITSRELLCSISRLTRGPACRPSTFRLPSRITLTDSKREAWFSDLASPSIPLSKLSRSVPHGYKGERGLDMLAHRKVEVDRAVWFVRAFGGVEIQSLAKTRPQATAIYLYTTEFTGVVCDFLRKQLSEVLLPRGGGPTAHAASIVPPMHSSPLGPPLTTTATTARARSGSLSMQAKAAAASAAAAAVAASTTAANASENGAAALLDEEKRKAWEDKYEYT